MSTSFSPPNSIKMDYNSQKTQFTTLESLPFLARNIQRLRRLLLSWFNFSTPSQYVEHRIKKVQAVLDMPYLLIEYINPSQGKMLSESWENGRHNPDLRMNLFRGLSYIMLNLSRTPLPKIGSFTIDKKGYLHLNNRPLTSEIQQLENENIPVNIPRNITFTTADSYVNSILSFHDSRLRCQPNGIKDTADGFYQTSALMVMKSVWPCFFQCDLLRGPFYLNLTDYNQSNIFVDEDWNIRYLIDLEWACSQPAEMVHPPYWLTNQAIDLIEADDYKILHGEFMNALRREESKMESSPGLSTIMGKGWEQGKFWYSLALSNPSALFKIFYDHIQPIFSKSHDDPAFWKITMPYWAFNTFDFIERRVKDKEQYDISLRKAFEE